MDTVVNAGKNKYLYIFIIELSAENFDTREIRRVIESIKFFA